MGRKGGDLERAFTIPELHIGPSDDGGVNRARELSRPAPMVLWEIPTAEPTQPPANTNLDDITRPQSLQSAPPPTAYVVPEVRPTKKPRDRSVSGNSHPVFANPAYNGRAKTKSNSGASLRVMKFGWEHKKASALLLASALAFAAFERSGSPVLDNEDAVFASRAEFPDFSEAGATHKGLVRYELVPNQVKVLPVKNEDGTDSKRIDYARAKVNFIFDEDKMKAVDPSAFGVVDGKEVLMANAAGYVATACNYEADPAYAEQLRSSFIADMAALVDEYRSNSSYKYEGPGKGKLLADPERFENYYKNQPHGPEAGTDKPDIMLYTMVPVENPEDIIKFAEAEAANTLPSTVEVVKSPDGSSQYNREWNIKCDQSE